MHFESNSGLFWHFVCCNVAQMSHLFHTNHPLITHSNHYFGSTKPLWSISIEWYVGGWGIESNKGPSRRKPFLLLRLEMSESGILGKSKSKITNIIKKVEK